MKKLLSLIAIMAVTVCTAMAQVVSDPILIPYAYTGKIVLTYNPNAGWGSMYGADHCYSHIGLITSESVDMHDWKFVKDDAWGQPTEPEWTKLSNGNYQLEINNMFTYFGCPATTKIKAIVMVFHDGRGGSSMEGKDRDGNDIVIWLEDEAASCHYYMDLGDKANDSWNGDAKLTVKEGTFSRDFWVDYYMSPKRVYVPCYGGDPEFVWTAGSWDMECTIAIYKSNGVCVYTNDGTMAAGSLYTATTPMCDASPNPWEVKNLAVEAYDPSKPRDLTFSWDAVSAVDKYRVAVYQPDKSIWDGPYWTTSTSYNFDLTDALLSGDYSFEVAPANSAEEIYCAPSKLAKNVVVPPVGETEISLLIPTDNDFDITHDIYAYWRNSADGSVNGEAKLTRDGTSRVWKGNVNIAAAMYDLQFYNEKANKVKYQTHTLGGLRKGGCFEVCALDFKDDSDPELTVYSYHMKQHDDCSKMLDHDYTISNVTITPGQANFNIKITAANKANMYNINLYRDENFSDPYFTYTTDQLDHTEELYNTEVVEIRSWEVVALDDDYFEVGTIYARSTGYEFDILPSVYTATNVKVEHTGVGTYKVSFDAVAGVDKFSAYFMDQDYDKTDAGEVVVKVTPPTGGRYTLETTAVPNMMGRSCVYIKSMKESTENPGEYNDLVTTAYQFTGKVKLHAYVPADSDFPAGSGLFAWVWSPTTFKDGFCYEVFDVGGGHYENAFYVDDSEFKFLYVNKKINSESDWAGSKQTLDSKAHIYYENCAEIPYKPNSKQAKWALNEYDFCSGMSDHDYRINSVAITTVPGRVEFEISPYMSYADKYRVRVNVKGVPEAFYAEDIYGTVYSVLAMNTEDLTLEYSVVPLTNNEDTLAAAYVSEVFVPKNTFVPKNLKAEVQSDGKTVNFSWTVEAAPYKWAISVHDKEGTMSLYDNFDNAIDGSETSLSAKVYKAGECTWWITGLDISNHVVSEVQGPNFTIGGTDYSPTNIAITTDGLKATITWEAPEDVKLGGVEMFDSGDAYVGDLYDIVPTAGKFSATLTASTDGMYYFQIVSYMIDGSKLVFMSGRVQTEKVELTTAVPVTLTISAAGEGGTVNESVNGTYNKGDKVTIIATPKPGYAFVQWSDGDKNATREIVMDGDKTLQATFISTSVEYEVTIKAGENGNVTPTGYDKTNVSGGTTIDIAATANPGYVFLNWSDGSTDASRSIIITQDTVLEANFVEFKQYEVTIKAGAHGSVTPTGYDKTKVDAGTKIDITATADPGYVFLNWSDGNSEASRSIVVTEDITLEANFVEYKEYEVTIKAADENGKVTPTGYNKKKVPVATVIDIKATPEDGYKFVEWSDGITDAERTIVITQDTVLIASFEEIPWYDLTVVIEPEDAGIVYFNGKEVKKLKKSYEEGTTVKLTAEAEVGYKFAYWEENSKTNDSEELSVVMNKSRKITAVFEEETGIENVTVDTDKPCKVLIDGQIYILRGDKIYTPTGAVVK